jgi:bifunctional enzyme CysN/CysC/sulfate adenylyltransferase subunit 1
MSTHLEGGDIIDYLHKHEQKEILRFVSVGSVDDGKSTLIGRLLHDTSAVFEDQLSAVKRASARAGTEIDFSLFTDGLLAEREQGITIDVAYRYFSTERRKFIIADTPGHVQYTRNMATGASTADVALILVDARLGILPQSRRHAYIASLLGIKNLVCCVNKMDLVSWDEKVFTSIRAAMSDLVRHLSFEDVTFIPISALMGDNIVDRSDKSPYYAGPTILEYLETVPVGDRAKEGAFRFPVQTVIRPHLDYRGYAGQIASGRVRVGDPVTILPSRKTSRIVGIDTFDGSLEEAFAPMSVTLRIADEIDVSRGDMLVHEPPRVTDRFEATLVWMHERPLDRGKSYLLKHTTQTTRAEVAEVRWSLDLETVEERPAESLALNDIGRVTIQSHKPLFVDPYTESRATGAFILVDSLTNDTVAAGMITGVAGAGSRREGTQVSAAERKERIGHAALAVVLEGGTRDLACAVERILFDQGILAAVADDAKTADALVAAGIVVVTAANVQLASTPLVIPPDDPEVIAKSVKKLLER